MKKRRMNLTQHTLRSYDQQLSALLTHVLDMGAEVRQSILAAKQSLRERDESKVADAKAADKHINALDRQIEDEATIILALQNPMAIDLRFVTSVLKITGILEQAGDLAKGTVKRSVKMGDYASETIIGKLERMADAIIDMLDLALVAVAEKSTDKAIDVWKRDDEVDTLYRDIIAAAQQDMTASPNRVAGGMQVVFAAKNLENLADLVTNLAKTVYYITSGQRADKAMLRKLAENAN